MSEAVINSGVLAIDGGEPVRTAAMPPRLAIGPDERHMLNEALDYYHGLAVDPGYQGIYEERYCSAFVEMMGGGYADAVATGTAAVYVALGALNLPAGSEVVVSPITDPGTLSAIILRGLTPRIADSMAGSYNAGPEQFCAVASVQTSCFLVVHNAGQAAPVDEIVSAARQRRIAVLEDCSQSHGAYCGAGRVGTFGDIAAFSTMYRKASIAGSSSGIVFARDAEIFHRALAHADRGKPRWREGFDDRNPAEFLFPALNLHSDELSSAMGLASVRRLDDTRRRRLEFVEAVADGIARQSQVCRTSAWSDRDSPFIVPVFVDAERLRVDKDRFATALIAEGIPLSPHYRYLCADWPWLHPYLASPAGCGNARAAIDSSFCLYVNENYGPDEARDVLAAISKVEAAYLR